MGFQKWDLQKIMTLVYIANTTGLSQHVSFFTVTHCSKLFMRNRFVAVWPVGKAQAGGNGLGSTKNFSTLSDVQATLRRCSNYPAFHRLRLCVTRSSIYSIAIIAHDDYVQLLLL